MSLRPPCTTIMLACSDFVDPVSLQRAVSALKSLSRLFSLDFLFSGVSNESTSATIMTIVAMETILDQRMGSNELIVRDID